MLAQIFKAGNHPCGCLAAAVGWMVLPDRCSLLLAKCVLLNPFTHKLNTTCKYQNMKAG